MSDTVPDMMLTNPQYRYGCSPKQLEFPFVDEVNEGNYSVYMTNWRSRYGIDKMPYRPDWTAKDRIANLFWWVRW